MKKLNIKWLYFTLCIIGFILMIINEIFKLGCSSSIFCWVSLFNYVNLVFSIKEG